MPFQISVNNKAFFIETLKRSTLQKLLPDGGPVYGTTEPVASQEAEITRVEKIVTDQTLAGERPAQRATLVKYLLNFARHRPRARRGAGPVAATCSCPRGRPALGCRCTSRPPTKARRTPSPLWRSCPGSAIPRPRPMRRPWPSCGRHSASSSGPRPSDWFRPPPRAKPRPT